MNQVSTFQKEIISKCKWLFPQTQGRERISKYDTKPKIIEKETDVFTIKLKKFICFEKHNKTWKPKLETICNIRAKGLFSLKELY